MIDRYMNHSLFPRMVTPVVKIVGNFCNLRCNYCFYNDKNQLIPHVMGDKLLEKFLFQYMKLFSNKKKIRFIWHGGEPLLAGLSFFKKIILFQNHFRTKGQKINNLIQTNGTLINEEWALFLKKYDFGIGISLDGGKESHNRFRKYKSGKGSFNQVMKGIDILRKYGIKFGVIQTITSDNIVNAEDDFNFFVNTLGIKKWGINVYLDIENNNKGMVNQSVSNDQFTQFLKTYIDFWLDQNDEQICIREIENLISGAYRKKPLSCSFNGSCSYYFCLDYNGKIYPCDRSSFRSDLLLGDLSKQSLASILNGFKRRKYIKDIAYHNSDCLLCEWQKVCHNGCPMLRVDGIRGKYYFCETRKTIFKYLRQIIQEYEYLTEKEKGGGRDERIKCH